MIEIKSLDRKTIKALIKVRTYVIVSNWMDALETE